MFWPVGDLYCFCNTFFQNASSFDNRTDQTVLRNSAFHSLPEPTGANFFSTKSKYSDWSVEIVPLVKVL